MLPGMTGEDWEILAGLSVNGEVQLVLSCPRCLGHEVVMSTSRNTRQSVYVGGIHAGNAADHAARVAAQHECLAD